VRYVKHVEAKDIYTAMLVGISIFVAGMLVLYLLIRHFSHPSTAVTYVPYVIREKVEQNDGEIISALNDIKKAITSQYPSQVTDMVVNVGDKVKMLYGKNGLGWQSFTITNVGSSPVYLAVNDWKRPEAPIYPGENIDIDFKRSGAIERIYLKCDEGQSTTVKIHAVK